MWIVSPIWTLFNVFSPSSEPVNHSDCLFYLLRSTKTNATGSFLIFKSIFEDDDVRRMAETIRVTTENLFQVTSSWSLILFL